MSNNIERDDEMDGFMDELASGFNDTPSFGREDRKVDPITNENYEEKILESLSGILSDCGSVSETLRDRIDSGDTYEGTMVGFAQTTDNILKIVKVLESRKTLKEKHDLEMKKLKQAHEYRLTEIEKRGEQGPKSIGTMVQNNTFVGSREAFMKEIKKPVGLDEPKDDVVDVEEVKNPE